MVLSELLLFFFILPPPRFPDDNFDRQAGQFQNFNRSHVMVIGRSVSFSDPARPPGGGVGAPNTPTPPPPTYNTVWRSVFPSIYLFLITFFIISSCRLTVPIPDPEWDFMLSSEFLASTDKVHYIHEQAETCFQN